MYDKQDLKVFLLLIVMTLLNLFVLAAILLFMTHGSVRNTALIATGLNVILFVGTIIIGVKEGDRHNK